MNNHIHLLVQTSQTSLSNIIHNLAFRYSQEINRRHKKIGHLFQGRFKSILLDEEGYFLKLIRYIHMNPVRAKLVNNPEEHLWSSHNAYLNKDDFVWLTRDYGLAKFSNLLSEARLLYNGFVLRNTTEEELNELRKEFKDGQVLGSDDFLETIRGVFQVERDQQVSLSVIVDSACAVFEVEKTMLATASQARKLSNARGAIAMFAREKGISLEEVAAILKRDSSGLCHLCNRFSTRLRTSSELQHLVNMLTTMICQLAD